MSIFESLDGFVWDAHNEWKNAEKHGISIKECEEVFLSKQYIVFDDIKHSSAERRFAILGLTEVKRQLSIAFVIRKKKVRVISARPSSKKERNMYEKTFSGTKI